MVQSWFNVCTTFVEKVDPCRCRRAMSSNKRQKDEPTRKRTGCIEPRSQVKLFSQRHLGFINRTTEFFVPLFFNTPAPPSHPPPPYKYPINCKYNSPSLPQKMGHEGPSTTISYFFNQNYIFPLKYVKNIYQWEEEIVDSTSNFIIISGKLMFDQLMNHYNTLCFDEFSMPSSGP